MKRKNPIRKYLTEKNSEEKIKQKHPIRKNETDNF